MEDKKKVFNQDAKPTLKQIQDGDGKEPNFDRFWGKYGYYRSSYGFGFIGVRVSVDLRDVTDAMDSDLNLFAMYLPEGPKWFLPKLPLDKIKAEAVKMAEKLRKRNGKE